MRSRLIYIGLIVVVIALLLGNLAICVVAVNDPQTKNPQKCQGSRPDECDGHCVNFQNDRQNCGICGNVCRDGEVCQNGGCVNPNNKGASNNGINTNTRATCTDGKKNRQETDIDCGGPTCPACADEKTCKHGTDCSSGVCAVGFCQAPSCIDQVKNGGETGVDCGGPCKPCLENVIGNITVLPIQNAPGTPAPNLTLGPPATTPTYKFVLDGSYAVQTRAPQQDTDFASMGVSVNNQVVIGAPTTEFVGFTKSNNYYPIGLEVGPIPIPTDPNVPVIIVFLIVNSGTVPSNVEYIMDGGTDALLLSYVPGSGSMLAFADKNVGNMLTSYCDGTVAANRIVTNGQEIAQWTAKGPYKHVEFDAGSDSAVGCGSNSIYNTDWHVEKVS